MSESKTISEWISSLPEGELRSKLWDLIQDISHHKAESMAKVIDLAYLRAAWKPECPFWYGVSMYFEGSTPPEGIPEDDEALMGYRLAKKTMEAENPGGGDSV
jgi:hypothetical protein